MNNQEKRPLPHLPRTTGEFSHPEYGSIKFQSWNLGSQQDILFKKEDKQSEGKALLHILNDCVLEAKNPQGKEFQTVDDIPLVLAEKAFLEIRAVTISDTQDFELNCENCSTEETPVKMRVQVDLRKASIKTPEDFKRVIALHGYAVEVKLPSVVFLGLSKEDLAAVDPYKFIADNINTVSSDEGEIWDFSEYTQEERLEFVNSLPSHFVPVFMDNYNYLPRVVCPIEGTCRECGHVHDKEISGVAEVFI